MLLKDNVVDKPQIAVKAFSPPPGDLTGMTTRH